MKNSGEFIELINENGSLKREIEDLNEVVKTLQSLIERRDELLTEIGFTIEKKYERYSS